MFKIVIKNMIYSESVLVKVTPECWNNCIVFLLYFFYVILLYFGMFITFLTFYSQ